MTKRPTLFHESSDFRANVRQKLLFESYYNGYLTWFSSKLLPTIKENFQANSSSNEGMVGAHGLAGDWLLSILQLHYTAGQPVEELAKYLSQALEQYEKQASFAKIENENTLHTEFTLTFIDDYVKYIGLLSLAILLRQNSLIIRIHNLIAGSDFDRQDALVEELLSHYLPERPYLDEWYHDEPYRWLLDSTAGDTQEEKLADLKKYLVKWCGGMKGTGWYDAHKGMTDEGMGGYDGYWAWEAGAIAFLHDIDDSTIDSMYYPKDLVAYARSFGPPPSEAEGIETAQQRLRCEAGNACPKSGYWVSPAYQQGDKYFKQGEVMPHIEGNQWGATIWQFVRE